MAHILAKTAKGLREATGKTHNLARDLRDVLKVCRGQFSVEDVTTDLAAIEREAFALAVRDLLAHGYLREIHELSSANDDAAGATSDSDDLDFMSSGGSGAELTDARDQAGLVPQDAVFLAQAQLAGEAARRLIRESERSAEEKQRAQQAEAAEAAARQKAAQKSRWAEQKAALEASQAATRQAHTEAMEAAERDKAKTLARGEDEQRTRRDAEERKRAERKERARLEADETARLKAEEKKHRAEQERLRHEAEALARAAREERARLEAEERERRKAEEKKHRAEQERLRHQTEALARAAREERARLEAEETARRKAEEKKHRAEQERLRHQTEALARAEREERARLEAEETARLKAEEKKHRAEQERIRHETEALARAEREERARLEALEQVRHRAAEEALREAERQAQREAKERARREEENRIQSETEAREQAEREERARLETEEKARRKSEEQARREEAERKRLEAEERDRELIRERLNARLRGSRRRNKLIGAVFGTISLIAALLFGIQSISFDGKRQELEALASKALGAPVHARRARIELFPGFRWTLQEVSIGSNERRVVIDKIALGASYLAIFSLPESFASLQADGVRLPLALAVAAMQHNTGKLPVNLDTVTLHRVVVSDQQFRLPSLEIDLALNQGRITGFVASASEPERGNLQLKTQQESGFWHLALTAQRLFVPLGLGADFSDVTLSARLLPERLELSEFAGSLYSGNIHGNGVLDWQDGWRLQARYSVSRLDASQLAPGWIEYGYGAGEGELSAAAKLPATLFGSAMGKGRFVLDKGGRLAGIDLERILHGRGADHPFHFDSITGDFRIDGKRAEFSDIVIKAKTLSSRGKLSVAADQSVSGRFRIDVLAPTVRLTAGFGVGGTLSAPVIKPDK